IRPALLLEWRQAVVLTGGCAVDEEELDGNAPERLPGMGAFPSGRVVDRGVGRDDHAVPMLVVDPRGAGEHVFEGIDLMIVHSSSEARIDRYHADDEAVGRREVVADGFSAGAGKA